MSQSTLEFDYKAFYEAYPEMKLDTLNTYGLVEAGARFQFNRDKLAHAQLMAAAEALASTLNSVLDCFRNDDWSCDRCGKDQEMENCNAAYYAREALEKFEAFKKAGGK